MPTTDGEPLTAPLPLSVYPNNQQHIHHGTLTDTTPVHVLHLFAWTHGFGIILSHDARQRALLLPASPPGFVSTETDSNSEYRSINIASSTPCMPGTNKSSWGFMPCHICPPKTLNNGTSGTECEPCIEDDNSSSSLCFRGARHKIDRTRLVDLEQVNAFPDSPDSTEFDDVLLNHVFKLVPGSDSRALAAVPIYSGAS
jgi:hypothetical protein